MDRARTREFFEQANGVDRRTLRLRHSLHRVGRAIEGVNFEEESGIEGSGERAA